MTELLDRLGWSQTYFARHFGVSERTVGRWVKEGAPKYVMRYLELMCKLVNV